MPPGGRAPLDVQKALRRITGTDLDHNVSREQYTHGARPVLPSGGLEAPFPQGPGEHGPLPGQLGGCDAHQVLRGEVVKVLGGVLLLCRPAQGQQLLRLPAGSE